MTANQTITILSKDVGLVIWSKKCEWSFYRFATISDLQRFYVDLAFIIVTVNFSKNGKNSYQQNMSTEFLILQW